MPTRTVRGQTGAGARELLSRQGWASRPGPSTPRLLRRGRSHPRRSKQASEEDRLSRHRSAVASTASSSVIACAPSSAVSART
eukprot:2861186-Heterocapsa_arctica.AAC.1